MAGNAADEEGRYNAADDLIGRNIAAGRADKVAVIDNAGSYTYAELDRRASRFANVLGRLGVRAEQRVLLVMLDSVDFHACFLGAIRAGVIPVPVNTRLTARDYALILEDSRATALVVSEPLVETALSGAPAHPWLGHIVVSGADGGGHQRLAALMEAASDQFRSYPTTRDDMCFWLYTSGTTGGPKGVVHLHSHLMDTADTYAVQVLGIRESDVVYSAAKLFFAYGLGNALTFPMAVGATAVLHAGPPEPKAVIDILTRHRPTLFFGVPTLYAILLSTPELPAGAAHALRLCVSAGEALPAELLRRWRERMGVDILDGIGTTEMLHIFISNRPDAITPNATGLPVPGYAVRLVDDDGNPVAAGEMGALEVSGPTAAVMYWNQRAKSLETFRGRWTRTGDKYRADENGVLFYCGRNDDMLKVGGIYVSPFEVEAALTRHEAVLEAAVVGQPDQDELIKPKAFVVLKPGTAPSDALAEALKTFVRNDLASYKYPRWIEFIEALPKTATGKIQRFKLRPASPGA